MTTTCLMAAEAVVGVMTHGRSGVGVAVARGGADSCPEPQPLRTRVEDKRGREVS